MSQLRETATQSNMAADHRARRELGAPEYVIVVTAVLACGLIFLLLATGSPAQNPEQPTAGALRVGGP